MEPQRLAIAAFCAAGRVRRLTVSRSHLDSVREYVRGQEEHHRRHTFQDEYRAFLEKHEIEFDPRYLW
jgi:hypothetical protein